MRYSIVAALAVVAPLLLVPAAAPAPTAPIANVVGSVAVPNGGNILLFAGSLWVTDSETATLARIDPLTKRVVARIRVGEGGTQLAGGEGSVWVTNFLANSVSRVDPISNSVAATIPVGPGPEGIAVTAGAVWVANHFDATVSKIDAGTDRLVDTIHLGAGGPQFVAAGGGAVWVAVVRRAGGLVRIDPQSDRVTAKISLPILACGALAVIPGAIWVAGGGCSFGLVRVDPVTGAVLDSIGATANALFVATGFGSLWYTELFTGFLVRVDLATDGILGAVQLGGEFAAMGIATDSKYVWVASPAAGTVVQLKPL